ncbi:MAG: hypothetical protein HKN23_02150 [Verrucomicrobiales bacterium]|nr:hypothetical protein [Verrucomicrobiales bacterium]
MKRILLPLILSAAASVLLPSCVVYESSGYATSSSYGTARPHVYRDTRGFSPSYYPGRYSPGLYDSYRRHPYASPLSHRHHDYHRYHNHRAHDHSDHREPEKNLVHRPGSYRITGGSTGSKVKPKGYHSIDWYKKRGYDVNKLRLETEEGDPYRKKKKK